MIETKRLRLMPWEDAHFQAIMQNDLIELGKLLDCETPKQWTTFADMIDAVPFFYEGFKKGWGHWGSFFAVHKIDRQLLGTCGYKGGPNENKIVEIGYEIIEGYRLQGLATEVAQGLVDFALSQPEIERVWAHTLPQKNPSVSVLKKLGFEFIGVFNDPEDGDVWGFEILKKK